MLERMSIQMEEMNAKIDTMAQEMRRLARHVDPQLVCKFSIKYI